MRCSVLQKSCSDLHPSLTPTLVLLLLLQVLCWEEIWGIQTERARVQSVSNPRARRRCGKGRGFNMRDQAGQSVWQQAVTCENTCWPVTAEGRGAAACKRSKDQDGFRVERI